MAIIIKEIQVKTVVERAPATSVQWDETAIRKMKDQIYRQLKDDMRKELRRRKER